MDDKNIQNIDTLLRATIKENASDMFVTKGFPPAVKRDGKIIPITHAKLDDIQAKALVCALMNEKQLEEYKSTNELNFAVNKPGIGRFRVNAFIQQGACGMVLRVIDTQVPNIDELGLPGVLKEIIMSKRGLVIMVGGTGSGKSTSLAAMVDHRNTNSHGHIITIEDPIEFVHPHKNCIVMQREVGVDTLDWEVALKNTLRQAPDVILLGEIRDRETMEFGITFAETGHLALATLHANSANQALDRIINFFPQERRGQLLTDLSLNLRAVISQRLVKKQEGGGRVAAVEILKQSPLVADLIFKGEIHGLKELMAKSNESGMRTFDQALFELYLSGSISLEEAVNNADSQNELRLRIKLEGQTDPTQLSAHRESGLSLQKEEDYGTKLR
jgi:twitching motility protein PilU